MTGTYVLALWLAERQCITIGRLGDFDFPPGWYLYAGSALGPGGLGARLVRHWRRTGEDKRAHWHVDYVRDRAAWGGAWTHASRLSLECAWAAELLGLPAAAVEVRAFGSSDCRCPAHLVHVPALPDAAWFSGVLGAEPFVVNGELLSDLLQTLVEGEAHTGSESCIPRADDDERRDAAAVSIGRFGQDAIAPLTGLLAEGDADGRWWAARALAEVGVPGAVGPLADALGDPDPDVRACAALALGRLGDAAAAPGLAACLADESDFVAGVAADALSMLGEAAVTALVRTLADERPRARLLAVRALGRIRSERAIGPIFEVLEDPSYLVRYHAREALDALGVGMVFVTP